MHLHSEKSKALIKDVDVHLTSENITSETLRGDIWLQSIQGERNQLFRKLVKGGAFIDNDTLDQFVNGMIDRIVESNVLTQKKRKILILNSPDVNAFCYGPGLFVVTVGLLGKINLEEEFAFILAHEIAHDELHHIERKLKREMMLRFSKNSDNVKKQTSAASYEDLIVDVRSVLHKKSSFNRECEFNADSLALVYSNNAGYSVQGAIAAMTTLDRATEPKQRVDNFFRPLQFSNFPFKNYWLDNRLSVYSHRPADTFFFAYDSLLSHPEIEIRKTKFVTQIENFEVEHNEHRFDVLLKMAVQLAEFQTVEAAYQTRQYDIALFQILQLQKAYPANPYLVSRSAKLMMDLFDAKNENTITDYVAKHTSNYGQQLKEVNNLLYNISKEEAIEIAFHIVNNQSNFNRTERSHYYLLWQICRLTQRDQVKKRIEQAYESKFGNRVESYTYR
ncbi:MAG: M48 family metalloprotease [Chryseolinea sp.]